MKTVGTTDLVVSPLCLGGNVFGWTVDERGAFDVLDAFVASGGNFIDTAEDYSVWVPGNSGGESETILGRWMAKRGNRESVVIATKVSTRPGRERLTSKAVRAAAEDSLRRLQIDCIDLYYAHRDDEHTPLQETLDGFDRLVREGKVRHIGASNYTANRLAEALRVSDAEGMTRYTALQPRYNLMERDYYEGDLAGVCEQEGIACIPYWSLAQGFLTGKYRNGEPHVDSARAEMVSGYLDERGTKVLGALDDVAEAHAVSVAGVALAWLGAQPTVLAPVASARTVEQLTELNQMADLTLSRAELDRLGSAATPTY